MSGSLRTLLRDSSRSSHRVLGSRARPSLNACVHPLALSARGLATIPSWTRSNSRITTLFTTLIALGVASTAYGLYEFYSMFTLWPKEVRADLRAGMKAKHQGDYSKGEAYLRRAYETALSLPLSAFSPAPHLKLSGIAVALASVLEAANKPEPAYEVYSDALSRLKAAQSATPDALSGPERMRGVALASKLGEMAEEYQLPVEEEEKWLTWAVEELLRVVRDEDSKGDISVEGQGGEDAHTPLMLAELDIPPWVSKTDLGAPLEALGRFHSREGNVEYAIPLYLQAISILVPPAASKKAATVEERCRGAQLMNNLAELTIRVNPTEEKRRQAEAWARQGLATIEQTKATAKSDPELSMCDQALAAVLFNLGSLLEMGGDTTQSRSLYKQSLDQAKSIQMREGVIEAQAAIRRLDRATKRNAISSEATSHDQQ